MLAGIESMFPEEPYYAWYHQPTSAELRAAHSRVAQQLGTPGICVLKQQPDRAESVFINTDFGRDGFGNLTPPETPILTTPPYLTASMSFYSSSMAQSPSLVTSDSSALGIVDRDCEKLTTGLETPESYPSTAGPRTPLDAGVSGSYDGLICFSQGCAVSTGLLLELMGNKMGLAPGSLPVSFVILICGGRPFDSRGTMERVDALEVARITLPSIHIHGRKDPGVIESRRLASLYEDKGKHVIELDIGHCPPRRTSDVHLVAAAIRQVVARLK